MIISIVAVIYYLAEPGVFTVFVCDCAWPFGMRVRACTCVYVAVFLSVDNGDEWGEKVGCGVNNPTNEKQEPRGS